MPLTQIVRDEVLCDSPQRTASASSSRVLKFPVDPPVRRATKLARLEDLDPDFAAMLEVAMDARLTDVG